MRHAARAIADLGADRLRVTAGWNALAPGRSSLTKPADFDPADSRTYPREPFEALDRAIVSAAAAGLEVQVDLAFWAPRWAVRRPARSPLRHRFKPDPQEFAELRPRRRRPVLGHVHGSRARRRQAAAGRASVDDLERAELPVLPRAAVEEDAQRLPAVLAAPLPADARARLQRAQGGQPGQRRPDRRPRGERLAARRPRRRPAARVPAHAGVREQDAGAAQGPGVQGRRRAARGWLRDAPVLRRRVARLPRRARGRHLPRRPRPARPAALPALPPGPHGPQVADLRDRVRLRDPAARP